MTMPSWVQRRTSLRVFQFGAVAGRVGEIRLLPLQVSGRFPVGDDQDLPGAALFAGKQFARQHQGVMQVGAGNPVVPGQPGQIRLLQFAGIVGEADHVQRIPGILLADEGEQGQRNLFWPPPSCQTAPIERLWSSRTIVAARVICSLR